MIQNEQLRVLLLANTQAGVGHSEQLIAELGDALVRAFGDGASVVAVSGHEALTRATEAYLRATEDEATIIVAGGGGSTRAVVEGIYAAHAQKRVMISALRLGSGNLLAKQFGINRYPQTALREIIRNIQRGNSAACAVMRCDAERFQQPPVTYYAVALAGFGQFGRVPRDVARWRETAFHRVGARLMGIERLTSIEYTMSLFLRFSACLCRPKRCEAIDVRANGREFSIVLLAGALMNFSLKALPFNPGVRVEDEAFALYLVPLRRALAPLLLFAPRRAARRAVVLPIDREHRVTLKLRGTEEAEFFLDEDPLSFERELQLMTAGTVRFVPGFAYGGGR